MQHSTCKRTPLKASFAVQAKGPVDGFGGDFVVPSYRGSTFLDPKVSLLVGSPPELAVRQHQVAWPARIASGCAPA